MAVAVPIAAQDASNEQQLSDWQVSGTCVWRISDGTLEIAPAPGQAEGTLEGSSEDGPGGFGWLRYANSNRSAIMRPGVKTPTCMGMFAGCTQLVQVDLCGLDASAATSFEGMFFECSKLASVDLSMLDGFKADDVSGMFSDCASLESVDLSGLAGSSPQKLYYLFYNCFSIKEIGLTALDTSKAKNLSGLFYNCTQLEKLDLSSFDTSAAVQIDNVFDNTPALREVRLGEKFSFFGTKQAPLCQLPASRGGHALGWKNSAGKVLASSEVPSNCADTYVAGLRLDNTVLDLFSRYYVCTGSPIDLILTTSLVEGADYKATFADNVNVGTGSVTFEGIKDYCGTLTFDFDIAPGVPEVSAPEGVVASWGQTLSQVALPEGWSWDNPDATVTSTTDYLDARATFTPADTRNYVSVSKVVRIQIDRDGSWVKDGHGWWWSRFDGTYPRSCWKRIGGSWYLFDASGYMMTGWQVAGGSWYWLGGSDDGALKTGWQHVGGSWYWLGDSGAMLTGWQLVGGSWYYLAGSGAMATGWLNLNGTWYWLDAGGAMAHDRWVGDYYLTGSGAMATSQWVGP